MCSLSLVCLIFYCNRSEFNEKLIQYIYVSANIYRQVETERVTNTRSQCNNQIMKIVLNDIRKKKGKNKKN